MSVWNNLYGKSPEFGARTGHDFRCVFFGVSKLRTGWDRTGTPLHVWGAAHLDPELRTVTAGEVDGRDQERFLLSSESPQRQLTRGISTETE